MTPSVRSFLQTLQMFTLGPWLAYVQARLYSKSSVDAMLNMVGTTQKLFNFTLSSNAQEVIRFWFFCANLPWLVLFFIPSTWLSYEWDAQEKYYSGGPLHFLRKLMGSKPYDRVSFIASIYKSLIQVFSLYDFIQQVAEWVQTSLLDWIYGEDFSEDETVSKSILGISSVIGFVVAVMALFGVLLATYGFFSKRNPHPDEDGPLKFCGYTIGKKTVIVAVLLYTLTNVVLYVKNIFPLFKALRDAGHSLLAAIIGALLLPFLIAYTGVNFKVYQNKAEKKLIHSLTMEEELAGQELQNVSLFSNRNLDRTEELERLVAPPLMPAQPSKLTSWGATLKEFFVFLFIFLFPLFALMATGFKSTAQFLQTADDSLLGEPYNWGEAAMAFLVTFFYYYAFCDQAKPKPQRIIDPVNEADEVNQTYFNLDR